MTRVEEAEVPEREEITRIEKRKSVKGGGGGRSPARKTRFGVASSLQATSALAPSTPGPGPAVVGCLVGVYPCSSTGPRGPASSHLRAIQAIQSGQQPGCRACCCGHNNPPPPPPPPPPPVQLTSQRGGLSLRVARVASTTSVRAAPYAHPQHQGLGQECR